MLLCGSVYASMYATGGTETFVPGTTDVVHTFTEDGTFTLSQDMTLRLIVVGGGGGGGKDCAGGGGGGGVIEADNVLLPAGTYTITVGAGGAGAKSTNVSIGGESTIIDSEGNVLYRALGGGGGVGWSGSAVVSTPEAPFASGGGGTNRKPGSEPGDPSQGHAGGTISDKNPQGGGGAGGPAIINGTSIGSGGPGIVSDISGKEEMYGAGGGGGSYSGGKRLLNSVPGKGGDGIYGFGIPEPYTAATSPFSHGRDGFGGGGGGDNNIIKGGADGGSGTVVFRLSNLDAEEPTPYILTHGLVSATPFSAVLSASVSAFGMGADTVALSVELADDAAKLENGEGSIVSIGAVTAVGVYDKLITGLSPAKNYYARFVAENNLGSTTVSDIFSFSTLEQIENSIAVAYTSPYAGLWQYVKSGSHGLDFNFDENSEGLTKQRGTVIAGSGSKADSAIYSSGYVDESGVTWKFSANKQYGYIGYMWMDAGHTYHIAADLWDSEKLAVDDVVLFSITDGTGQGVVATIDCKETGWHKVQIWFGGSSSGAGVRTGHQYGFAWNKDGTEWLLSTPGDGWNVYENTETNVFLVTSYPWRSINMAQYSASSASANFTLSLGESEAGPTKLLCVYGSAYGAEDTNAWENVVVINDGQEYDSSKQEVSYTLNNLPKLCLVRFCALHEDGTTTWTQTVPINSSMDVDVSNLGVDHDGDIGTFKVRVVGENLTAKLWLSTSATMENAKEIALSEITATGDYGFTSELNPETTYYYYYEVEDAEGNSAKTTIAQFTTEGQAELSSDISFTTYRHTITVSYNLDVFGAGNATEVFLIYGESEEDLSQKTTSLKITNEGSLKYIATIPGENRKIYFKLVVKNTAPLGTTWETYSDIFSTKLTDENVSFKWNRDFVEGEWTSRENWKHDASSDDNTAGWPNSLNASWNCFVGFENNTKARIHVGGSYKAFLRLASENSDIVIYGDGADASYLDCGDAHGGKMNGTSVTFESIRITELDIWDYTIGESNHTNAVVKYSKGTVATHGGNNMAIQGTNSCLIVEGNSYVTNSYLLRLSASGTSLVVDDSYYRVGSVAVTTPNSDYEQIVKIKGSSAVFEVLNGRFSDLKGDAGHKSGFFQKDIPSINSLTMLFEVPATGWTNGVPFIYRGQNKNELPFAQYQLAESTGKIQIKVDAAAMKQLNSKTVEQHILGWKSGICTDNVELVDSKNVILRYTYGWDETTNTPGVLFEPEVAGDLPTGIWCRAESTAGMIIIIK